MRYRETIDMSPFNEGEVGRSHSFQLTGAGRPSSGTYQLSRTGKGSTCAGTPHIDGNGRGFRVPAACDNQKRVGRETFAQNRSLPEILVWQWVAPYSSSCFTQNAADQTQKWGRMLFQFTDGAEWGNPR